MVTVSCDNKSELYGTWKSVRIENDSPMFKKILPSENIGEIILVLSPDARFRWINKKEKTDLNGEFTVTKQRITLNINGSGETLTVLYTLNPDRLVIVTDDGFTFTFIRYNK